MTTKATKGTTKGAERRADSARASGAAQPERARPQRGRVRAHHGTAQPGIQGAIQSGIEAGPQRGTRPCRQPRPTAASSPRPTSKPELEPEVPVAEQARRSRTAQGFPPTIQDPATLAYIARLLLPTIGKPRRSH